MAGVLIVALSSLASFALPRGDGTGGDALRLVPSGSLGLFQHEGDAPLGRRAQPVRAAGPERAAGIERVVRARHATLELIPACPVAPRAGRVPERTTSGGHDLEAILDAIRRVESGGEEYGGRNALGDGGRSIGPYQIQRAHWIDARLSGRFEDCRDPEYARREVIAYWRRWCPAALERRDAQFLARVHNGGPDGPRKASTLRYWIKVRTLLESSPAAR